SRVASSTTISLLRVVKRETPAAGADLGSAAWEVRTRDSPQVNCGDKVGERTGTNDGKTLQRQDAVRPAAVLGPALYPNPGASHGFASCLGGSQRSEAICK